MAQSLILLDTDRIKEYVFATGKLAEIRGASALLEKLNLQRTRETVCNVCPAAKVVFQGGGSALVEAPRADAERIITAIEALYRQEIEGLAAQVRQRLGIERTPTGWRIARSELIGE